MAATAARSPRRATVLRHQDLHDRLLATAEATIAADGLASLRARALADSVGCSVGAIYGVFADLDTLILLVNGRTLEKIQATMGEADLAGSPSDQLVRLADAYLDYAAKNRHRWRAIFQHQMPEGRPITTWYAERQAAAFARIEAPLSALRPALSAADRALLARTLFSAVHGMVELGLDEKVVAMKPSVLRAQLRLMVRAIAAGLAVA